MTSHPSSNPARADASPVAAVTAADGAPVGPASKPVEQYDRAVFDIVRWAQRGGWLCCVACGAYGPYTMVDGLAFCRACIREGSSRLFTAAEHAASEREARR